MSNNQSRPTQADHHGAPTWEEWQLTAYVLNELDEPTTQAIRAALSRDPSLAAEVGEIAGTVGNVRQFLATENLSASTNDDLQQERLAEILNVAEQSAEADTLAPTKVMQAAGNSGSSTPLGRRAAWVGLLGMAASLTLALYLGFPRITEWLTASSQLQDSNEASGDRVANEQPAGQSSSQAAPIDETLKTTLPSDSSNTVASAKDSQISEVADSDAERSSLFSVDRLANGPAATMATDEAAEPAPAQSGGQSSGQQVAQSSPGGSMDAHADAPFADAPFADAPFADAPFAGGYDDGGYGGAGGYAGAGAYGGEGYNRGGMGADSSSGGYGAGGYGAGGGGIGAGGYGAPMGGYGGEGLANNADGGMMGGMGGYGGGMGGMGYAGGGGGSENTPVPQNRAAGGRGGMPANSSSALSLAKNPAIGGRRGSTSANDLGVDSYAANAGGYGMGMGGTRRESLARSKGRSGESGWSYRGLGPGNENHGDQFAPIFENKFQSVADEPLSTLSIDVDTASYAKSRQLLLEAGHMPPPNAVRIEEFVNYFEYEYAGPGDRDVPFGADLAVARCPWRPDHQLVRIALQAEKLEMEDRPKANIVFLLDVSGSMDEPNKLPLVKESMRMLIRQLGENDRIAMAVYAGAAGCVLESTRGDKQEEILGALDQLNAGGSTNGGEGIALAYDLARDNFIPGGINRVILCTDGDFNVGVTSTKALVDLVEENAKSKIFLTVLGYGMGNTNDAMMEQISNRGNGVYGFVDNRREAHRQMVQQLAGNLMTVAKDVKIQVEFNPANVRSYRLLGYENRLLATEDFNDDTKDAGEIGAGHRVTALYEVVPVSAPDFDRPPVDDLRYQTSDNQPPESSAPAESAEPEIPSELNNELLAVKLRYKQPDEDVSQLLTFPLENTTQAFAEADRDFRWAASMVQFGMLMRHSRYAGNSQWSGLLEQAKQAAGVTPDADRQECLEMIRTAARLSEGY